MCPITCTHFLLMSLAFSIYLWIFDGKALIEHTQQPVNIEKHLAPMERKKPYNGFLCMHIFKKKLCKSIHSSNTWFCWMNEWMNEWPNKFTKIKREKKKPKNLSHHFCWSIFIRNHVNKWAYGKYQLLLFDSKNACRSWPFFLLRVETCFDLCNMHKTNAARWFAKI